MSNLIMIIFGVYFLLIGLGKISVSKNKEKNDEWMRKYKGFFFAAGPIMILCGGALLLSSLLSK